jgi:6-phosphogluconolactonase
MAKRWLTMAKLCFTSVMLVIIGFAGTAAADDGAGYTDHGAVYTMTNSTTGNEVVAYDRAADGTLTMAGTFATGGTSIGVFATGNQNGLLLSNDAHCLWAVNSSSSSISAFEVKGTSLSLIKVVGSGGSRPISLTVNEDLGVLYVLNAGGQLGLAGVSDNVTGFTIGKDCRLSPLAGSTRALSGSNVFPAQVSFNPDGSVVVVTEKTDDGGVRGGHITTFTVGRKGLLSLKSKSVAPVLSDGTLIAEPFGFAFDSRGRLLVTAADCSQPAPPGNLPGCFVPPDNPSLLSYTLNSNGTLTLVDSSGDGGQAAECWLVITGSHRWDGQNWDSQKSPYGQEFAFAVNAIGGGGLTPETELPAGSLTGYRVSPNGSLTRLGVTPVPHAPLGVPVDAALSRNSRFLYVLSEGDGTINAYTVGPDGGLTLLSTYPVETVQFPDPTAMPPVPPLFPNGLAAR